jgi:hypothetical protein
LIVRIFSSIRSNDLSEPLREIHFVVARWRVLVAVASHLRTCALKIRAAQEGDAVEKASSNVTNGPLGLSIDLRLIEERC